MHLSKWEVVAILVLISKWREKEKLMYIIKMVDYISRWVWQPQGIRALKKHCDWFPNVNHCQWPHRFFLIFYMLFYPSKVHAS